MTRYFEEVVKARLCIGADDATYGVQFDTEWLKGKTWEFDMNSDAIGQYEYHRTGKMRVRFNPVVSSMEFAEDANRKLEYVMSINDARILWKFLAKKEPHFWFALDIASQGELHGYSVELQNMMQNCAGCVTCVEPV